MGRQILKTTLADPPIGRQILKTTLADPLMGRQILKTTLADPPMGRQILKTTLADPLIGHFDHIPTKTMQHLEMNEGNNSMRVKHIRTNTNITIIYQNIKTSLIITA